MSSTVQSETGLMMATVNQQIDRLHTFFHLADSDFFCECGDRACTERVTLSRAEYAARTARSPSVLAPAHGGSNHRAIDLAKRLLAERGEMEPIEAFEILRSRARAQQRSLDAVCADYIAVIADREPDDDTAAQREKRARLGR